MSDLDFVRQIIRNTVDLTKLPEIPLPASGSGAYARVYSSVNIAIPQNTDTALEFDTERYDIGGLWIIGSPTRFTIPTDGHYRVGGNVEFDITSGLYELSVRRNGTTKIVMDRRPPAAASEESRGTILLVATEDIFEAGDYLELVVLQTFDATLNILAVDEYSPRFWIARYA